MCHHFEMTFRMEKTEKVMADLLTAYVSSGADLSPWLRDADINRDRSLRLQYMAGLTVDRSSGSCKNLLKRLRKSLGPEATGGSLAACNFLARRFL